MDQWNTVNEDKPSFGVVEISGFAKFYEELPGNAGDWSPARLPNGRPGLLQTTVRPRGWTDGGPHVLVRHFRVQWDNSDPKVEAKPTLYTPDYVGLPPTP